MNNQNIPYLLTSGGITLILDNKSVDISKTHPHYSEIVDAIKQKKATEEDIRNILFKEKIVFSFFFLLYFMAYRKSELPHIL